VQKQRTKLKWVEGFARSWTKINGDIGRMAPMAATLIKGRKISDKTAVRAHKARNDRAAGDGRVRLDMKTSGKTDDCGGGESQRRGR